MTRLMFVVSLLVATPAAAQSTAADVVHLVDGGIVRGTIVEHLVGDHTTVLLITGETRTLTADRIERVELGVGPRETAAGLSTPRRSEARAAGAPVGDGSTVHVRVRTARRRDLALHDVADGTDDAFFDTLCEIPCELELEPGPRVFGVSREDGVLRRPDHDRFEIEEDTELRVDFRSHSALRVGGWIMLVAGTLTGALLTGMSATLGMFGVGLGLYIPGVSLILFSLIHWLANAFRNDHVDMTAEPWVRF